MTKKTSLSEVDVRLFDGVIAKVAWRRSIDGVDYVRVKVQNKTAYVPKQMLGSEKADARRLLEKRGIVFLIEDDWRAIIKAAASIKKFRRASLVDRPGWSRPYFAMRDGKTFGPKGMKEAKAIFERVPEDVCVKGSLTGWLTQIGEVIAGQHLLMIAVLAALAAAIVEIVGEPQNFGLALSGPPETGKTTWLGLFASVAGRPSDLPSFNASKPGLEDMFKEFRDMPFPIDEANLADPRDKQFWKEIIFCLANGVPKVTRHQPERAKIRFLFATTANQPINEALGVAHGHTADAALQRLMPLRIDPANELGVFTFLPTAFASSGEFATYLSDAMARQYGSPMRAILEAVVDELARDAEQFAVKMRKKIEQFSVRAGVDAIRGKSRATSAIGLLFAAGWFAKEKGVLPKSWKIMEACLAAYRNYQSCLPDQTPLNARLLAIAQRAETLDLRDGSIPKLSDSALARHGAFLKLGKGKRVELLLTDKTKRQFFPDWASFKQTAACKALNPSAKGHDGIQRKVRLGKPKERFICFILPPELVAQIPARP